MWKVFQLNKFSSILGISEPQKTDNGFFSWLATFKRRNRRVSGGVPSLLWAVVVALVFTVWLVTLLRLMLNGSFFPASKRKPSKTIFFAAFHEKVRRVFKRQRKDTLDTIIMGTNRVLRKNKEEPTVFLVLVPRGTMDTATQLVTMLTHCVLVAYQYPANLCDIKDITTQGSNYTSHDDEWPFYYRLKKHLKYHGIAVVFSFEELHPQVVRSLQLLTPLVFAPFPESVLILVMDIRNRFTEFQKHTMTPNNLGSTSLQELLGAYMDQSEMLELINQIGSRCILVCPEDERNFEKLIPV